MTHSEPANKDDISTAEAATILHMTESYVRRLCRSGEIVARREGVGNRAVWYIRRNNLEAYQQQRRLHPPKGSWKPTRRTKRLPRQADTEKDKPP